MSSTNPITTKRGTFIHWRAAEQGGLWYAEVGTPDLDGQILWKKVGVPKTDKADAEGTAAMFARARADRA